MNDKKLLGYSILVSLGALAVSGIGVFFNNLILMQIAWTIGLGTFLFNVILFILLLRRKEDENGPPTP